MATANTDTKSLMQQKMLYYPLSLNKVDSGVDADNENKPYQYVKISINLPKDSTLLGDSSSTVKANTAAAASSSDESIEYINPDIPATYGTDVNTKTSFTQTFGKTVLDKTIFLPMPNDYIVTSKMNYAEQDPGFLVKAGDIASGSAGGVVKDLFTKGLTKGATSVLNGVKKEIFGGEDVLTEQQALAMQGLVVNPMTEVIYQSFDRRRFSFQYIFAPKNQLESATVFAIIQTLRYYSLPELAAGRLFYIFPAQFELQFMQGLEVNKYIPKIAPCVLESVSVNYSPGGNIWSTLPGGEPVAISMTINLFELELIDRTRVWNKTDEAKGGH